MCDSISAVTCPTESVHPTAQPCMSPWRDIFYKNATHPALGTAAGAILEPKSCSPIQQLRQAHNVCMQPALNHGHVVVGLPQPTPSWDGLLTIIRKFTQPVLLGSPMPLRPQPQMRVSSNELRSSWQLGLSDFSLQTHTTWSQRHITSPQ